MGNYEDGLRDGSFSSYYDNGNIEHEGQFSKGRRDGRWRNYNSDGTLCKETFYKNGCTEKSC